MNLLNSPPSPAPRLPKLTSRLKDLAVRNPTVTCAIPYCLTSVSVRKSAARRPGIELGLDWYCSSRCFAAAVEERLVDINLSRATTRERPDRMPLNLLLFRSGCLTHPQSIEASRQLRMAGGNLRDILLRLGYVTEEQITHTCALQSGYPVFSLGSDTQAYGEQPAGIGSTTPSRAGTLPMLIPQKFVDRYSMVPVHYVPATRRLLVGFVHQVEHGLLYAVEHMTDCAAEPCFLTPFDFERLRSRAARGSVDDQVQCDEDGRPADIARVISNCAVQISADEARLRRTRDYLWARLRSEGRQVDLLFPRPWSGTSGVERHEASD